MMKRQRDLRVEDSRKMRAAMKSGDERYLPHRDRGPVRRFIRDMVDARLRFGDIMIPVFIVMLIVQYGFYGTAAAQFAGAGPLLRPDLHGVGPKGGNGYASHPIHAGNSYLGKDLTPRNQARYTPRKGGLPTCFAMILSLRVKPCTSGTAHQQETYGGYRHHPPLTGTGRSRESPGRAAGRTTWCTSARASSPPSAADRTPRPTRRR